MRRDVCIGDILKPLSEVRTQAYISNALQVADVLEWLLSSPHPNTPQENEKCNCPPPQQVTVCQTTFSISEEFLRRIYFIKKRHPARFIVIIDRKALQKTVQLWRFISKVYSEVWISDNHSKILLVDFGDGTHASMVTSQNLTRGNRAESAVVSADNNIYSSLMKDFEDLKTNNSAPMHEVMGVEAPQPPEGGVGESGDLYEAIERLAGCFVTISEMAETLDMNPTELRELIADQDTPESRAYRKGKAKAKVAMKATEMELAKVGSPLGMQSVRENLLLMENDED